MHERSCVVSARAGPCSRGALCGALVAPSCWQCRARQGRLRSYQRRFRMAAVAEVEVATDLLSAIVPRADPNNSVDPMNGVDFQQRMAEALAEFGGEAFPLSGGDPDLPTPQHICDAANTAIDNGEHHYTDKAGILELRDAISAHIKVTDDLDYSADEIVVTTGVQSALMACFLSLAADGDEILVSAPTYRAYQNQAAMVGASVVEIPTQPETGFIVTPEALEESIAAHPKSKIFVHVSPNNPSGVVTPPEVVVELAKVCKKHGLVVLSDEIYSDMLYEDYDDAVPSHLSIASLPGMKERTVVLKGCSKAYAMTGWRVGYLAAPAKFCKIAQTMAGQIALSVSTPSQYAALAAFSGPQDCIKEYMAIYAERRQIMMGTLHRLGFKTYGGHGGYLMLVDIESGQSALKADEFCIELLRQTGLRCSPSQYPAYKKFVNMSWLQPTEMISEAFHKFERFVLALQSKCAKL
eukprot:COSAG02_NODE_33_length_50286_cov_83.550760_11_plen_467_part_00